MDPELKTYLDEWRAELEARFARVDNKLEDHDGRFDKIDRRLDMFDRRFDLFAEALVRVEHRLERAGID